MNYDELSPELKKKLQECKTPDDVLALAKEAGYELSEEELNAVNGGIDTDWACFDVHTHPCDPVKCYSWTPFLP